MAKSKEKLFIEAMKKKFEEDPTEVNTHYYTFGGWKQSKRKREWVEQANQIAKKRGIPMMNQDIGVPLGQRVLMPYRLSHTDIYAEADDLHFMNNAAMQQAWDDIRRTVIVGLDTAHSVIEKRLGKEVTPETINLYLETVNHAMPGGAVVQEHMAEVSPALSEDCYVKVFSGDDELISQIDKRFVIDINKEFPKEQAKQLKEAIGKSLYQAVHAPTLVGRVCDGGTISRWSAMQISMSFISAYRLAAGEAAIADFAYAAKHASVVNMGTMMPARRARGPNEPGGIPFGFLADMVQSTRVYPDDPAMRGPSLFVRSSDAQLYFGSWLWSASRRTLLRPHTAPWRHPMGLALLKPSSAPVPRQDLHGPDAEAGLRSTPTLWRCTRGTPPRWRPTSAVPSVPPCAAAPVSLARWPPATPLRCATLYLSCSSTGEALAFYFYPAAQCFGSQERQVWPSS